MFEEPGGIANAEEQKLKTEGAWLPWMSGVAKPNVDFSEIQLEEKVGHGSYGVVYKAVWRNRHVAVKEFGASAEQKAIETEVKQLSRVCHTNIIALFGISSDQQSRYLIMEYAEGGSLHNFLHGKVQPAYSRAHAMSWLLQCSEGVAYLHAMEPKPLIHRDLKPLNLLLTNKGRHLKICDFGTVADKSTMMTNNRGSAAWMAPEVFEGSNYTEKCDIFSWAIVLWEVLSRKQPFKEIDNTYSIMWKIHKGERPPLLHNCPMRIEELMTSCWKTAPEERPSMKYVVQVMTEIAAAYPGADQPLEYRFVNQQIITDDSCTTDERLNSRLYGTDCSTNSNQTQVTPPDVQSNTNTSGASTPTNLTGASGSGSGNGSGNSNGDDGGNGLFQTRAANVPQVAFVSTNRWEAIPEEESDINTCDTSNGCVNNDYDSFKLTPSAEAAKRFDTIRNVMIQGAPNPMSPLKLDVEPNAFDLSSNNSLAKTDGKERLAVSDAKIMPSSPTAAAEATTAAATTTVSYKQQQQQTQSNMGDLTNNNNNNLTNNTSNNNNYNNNNNNNKVTDDNDDTDQSLTEILDAELQPEPPIPNNPESQAIYREHRRLAKEYLSIETDLYYAQDLKEKLILQMDVPERLQKQELLLKIKDKESLMAFYNNLKQQFEKMRADEATADVSVLPHSPLQNQQHMAGGGVTATNDVLLLSNAMHNTAGGTQASNSENLCDDGWVMIPPNQNA